jgi:3'-phosphoadenosine 5'-phosphosulfate sulfotransferase (PAPS reductase)/FAD synthetase
VARKRWGVTIHQYPHFRLSEILRDGFCRPPSQKFADLPPLSVRDIQRLVQHDLGIDVVATGMRRSDSPHRRRTLKNTAMHTDVIHPIVGWKKLDVLAYMAMRHIPVPESTGGATSGVGLSPKSLLWLHDTFPNDFRKLCEVFPYAEAYVWRRTFHGVTA